MRAPKAPWQLCPSSPCSVEILVRRTYSIIYVLLSGNCHLHLRMLAIALLCESYQLPRAARPAHRPVWTATGHPYRSRTMLLSSTSNTLCAPPPDATKALAFAHGEAASDG